jgi:hypothetical protein
MIKRLLRPVLRPFPIEQRMRAHAGVWARERADGGAESLVVTAKDNGEYRVIKHAESHFSGPPLK